MTCKNHLIDLLLSQIPVGRRPCGRHILPYQVTETICKIIKPSRFNNLMNAKHIKAQAFGGRNVVCHRAVTGRCVQAARPIPLIQQAAFKQRLTVKKYLCFAANAWTYRNGSDADKALYAVNNFTVISNADFKAV